MRKHWFVAAMIVMAGTMAGEVTDSISPEDFLARHPDLKARAEAKGLPWEALAEAAAYLAAHPAQISRRDHLGIIDLDQHSGQRRFYLLDTVTGRIDRLLVSHGRNSDPDHTGFAQDFSNRPGSRMTSLGFYRVAEPYHGKHGYSVRLDGLEPLNSLARPRAIVIHAADYVDEEAGRAGRSWGCPAVDDRWIDEVIHRLRDGGLLYVHASAIARYREEAQAGPCPEEKHHFPDEAEGHLSD
ncbi:MAG: twin-arginine translocation pathway signal protein [Puniceicoccaceae bacterium]|nr:MAG: twin-arginine translocation pathway signal protein [Puniceicoccaceae bacterium]